MVPMPDFRKIEDNVGRHLPIGNRLWKALSPNVYAIPIGKFYNNGLRVLVDMKKMDVYVHNLRVKKPDTLGACRKKNGL